MYQADPYDDYKIASRLERLIHEQGLEMATAAATSTTTTTQGGGGDEVIFFFICSFLILFFFSPCPRLPIVYIFLLLLYMLHHFI